MATKGPKTGARSAAVNKQGNAPRAQAPQVPFADTAAVAPSSAASSVAIPERAVEAAAPAVPAPGQVAGAAIAAAENAHEIVIEAVEQTAQSVAQTTETVEQTMNDAVSTATHKNEGSTMNEMNQTAEAALNKTQNLFGDMNERTKAAMEKSAKVAEEMNDFAKGNVEAIVEASKIAAKGLESIGQNAADFGRRNFETATQTMNTLAAAKSPTEFFKLQGDFMRQSFDAFVAEASRNTEAMMKLAGDAAQPISNRVAVAAEKAKVAA